MTSDPKDVELTAYRSRNVSEEELKSLEDLLAENPEDLQIIDWVAFAHYCSGSLDRAVELYRKCVDREPQTASYYYFLGNALYRLNAVDDAIANWKMAVDQDRSGMFRKKAQERLDKALAKP